MAVRCSRDSIGGQVLPEDPDEARFRQVAREIGVNEDQYIEALHGVNVRSEEMINASAELLGQVLNHFINAEYTKKKSVGVFDKLSNGVNSTHALVEQIAMKTTELKALQNKQKILALNASVEAARAGAAGKGFAVVANEVQSLANKSAVAAQNITRLIGESMRLVHHGTALTADTTDALTQTVIGAKQATQLIEQIATSAMQQSNSLSCLTDGMGEINEVIQTNAETAEKSASAAGQLREQAEELKVSVEKFHLRH